MPKRREKKPHIPQIGRLLHRAAKGRHATRVAAAYAAKQALGVDELQVRVEFELTIEEAEEPVLDSTVGEIQQEARQILEDGGDDIVQTARQLAPFRTGALMSSIYYQVEDVTGLLVGATVSYAVYQEYGTERMAPHAFLQPAIDEHEPMIQEQLDEMIADKLAQDTSEDDPEFEFNREMELLETGRE